VTHLIPSRLALSELTTLSCSKDDARMVIPEPVSVITSISETPPLSKPTTTYRKGKKNQSSELSWIWKRSITRRRQYHFQKSHLRLTWLILSWKPLFFSRTLKFTYFCSTLEKVIDWLLFPVTTTKYYCPDANDVPLHSTCHSLMMRYTKSSRNKRRENAKLKKEDEATINEKL